MKMSLLSPRYPVSAAALAASILALPPTLRAETYTWDGDTAIGWGNLNNWAGGAVPTFNSTADVQIRPTVSTFMANSTIGGNRTLRSLTFGTQIGANPLGVNYNAANSTNNLALTFQADSGNSTLTVESGVSANITMGLTNGLGTGFLDLANNLDVIHDGSGTLIFNRPIRGTGFGITKSGTGTMQLGGGNTFSGNLSINQGVVIASAAAVNTDVNAAANININGGTLNFRFAGSGTNKTYSNSAISIGAAGGTLAHENTGATATQVVLSGSALTLSGNLTVRTSNGGTALANGFNITAPISGNGSIIVDGYNNVSLSTDTYNTGRLLIGGNNSAWTGDLVVSKGTVSLSGNGVNSSGNGTIILGTASDSFGAGLTFFPQGANATTATFGNNFTIRSGGFRSIKGSNTDHNITLTGDVLLEGSLNLDHTLSTSGRRLTLSGDISGAGGVNITRAAGHANTGVILDGTNTYLGMTNVASGAALGGGGSLSGDLSFDSGANFIFNTGSSLAVAGNVTFGGFGIVNLLGLDSATVAGSYVLLDGNGFNISQANVTNVGFGNAFDLGAGNLAYFDFSGGDMSVVVAAVPEPASFVLIGGLASLGAAGLRRRRRAA